MGELVGSDCLKSVQVVGIPAESSDSSLGLGCEKEILCVVERSRAVECECSGRAGEVVFGRRLGRVPRAVARPGSCGPHQ